MQTVIERLEKHAAVIRDGRHDRVCPGQAYELSPAASCGDGVWQGDLGLEIVAGVPNGYKLCEVPTLQLVPGTTQGARHCLDSLDGVCLFLPQGWQKGEAELAGPCLVLTQRRSVQHPVHGAVVLAGGTPEQPLVILCRYQREWDVELRRARRAAD